MVRQARKDDQHPAIRLMRALYAETRGGVVELRAIGDGLPVRRVFVSAPSQIVDFIEWFGQKDGDHHVYFGVNKREREDGTKKSIERVSALYVDIDTVKNGWDTDEFVKLVHAMPGDLRPSACVRSGGGLHLYWFLKPAATDIRYVEAVNVSLRDIFAGDAVQNVDRILRLPGSYNHKRKRKCELEWCHDFNRFDLEHVSRAALAFGKCIGDDGSWLKKSVQAKEDARKQRLDPFDGYAAMYGDNSRRLEKNIEDMWAKRVRYHAPRGYIGIHEAALITTARYYISNKNYPEETVLRMVMEKIEAVKLRDAPEEHWDMDNERATVLAMYRSWQPKWAVIERENRRQREAVRKQNGSPAALRQRRH